MIDYLSSAHHLAGFIINVEEEKTLSSQSLGGGRTTCEEGGMNTWPLNPNF